MNAEELKAKLAEIDDLVKSEIITEKRGKEWKERYIAEFERTGLPADDKPKSVMETSDLAHLPGRMVGFGLKLGAAILRGSGATYEGLSKQQGYLDKDGKPPKQRPKSPDEMLDDLPEIYK
jgi:hypothetical protein